jgi:hypothetical protein
MSFNHTFVLLSLISQSENRTDFCEIIRFSVSDRMFDLIQIENEDLYNSLQMVDKIYESMIFYKKSRWKYQNKWADQLENILIKLFKYTETTHIKVEW